MSRHPELVTEARRNRLPGGSFSILRFQGDGSLQAILFSAIKYIQQELLRCTFPRGQGQQAWTEAEKIEVKALRVFLEVSCLPLAVPPRYEAPAGARENGKVGRRGGTGKAIEWLNSQIVCSHLSSIF